MFGQVCNTHYRPHSAPGFHLFNGVCKTNTPEIIPQSVLWRLFTAESTASTYHPRSSNSESLVSGTDSVPQTAHSLLQLSCYLGRDQNMRSLTYAVM